MSSHETPRRTSHLAEARRRSGPQLRGGEEVHRSYVASPEENKQTLCRAGTGRLHMMAHSLEDTFPCRSTERYIVRGNV
uniref:Uncharacterized protein n=1 Tax=Gasterosteus aculeatus aculeatus TaxID=481459 RepID=A0AAQ4Q6Z4_GASAC